MIPTQPTDDPLKRAPNISSMKLVPVGLLLVVLSFLVLTVLIWAFSIGLGLYILMVPVIVFALIGIMRPNWGQAKKKAIWLGRVLWRVPQPANQPLASPLATFSRLTGHNTLVPRAVPDRNVGP